MSIGRKQRKSPRINYSMSFSFLVFANVIGYPFKIFSILANSSCENGADLST
jgi:hypothetical protein